jgi:dipeptide transport system permease protein
VISFLLLLLKKLLHTVPTLLAISILSFLLIRIIPGDPVLLLLGERGADPMVYLEMQKRLGLDLPWMTQYWNFLTSAITGDLGKSIISKTPVMTEFLDRFPATLELGLASMLIATLLGIPLGIIASIKRGTILDHLLMTGSLIGYSMPIFWWGLILILIFSVNLGLTPVAGRISVIYEIPSITGFLTIDSLFSEDGPDAFISTLRHLILPSVAMGTIPLAVIARMTRSALLEVLGQEYITAARARGIPPVRVIMLHALKNAMIPIITVIGLMVGSIITGAILTETIFSWPGIGKWMVASINARDYPVIQGGILLIASMIIMINALVDITYSIFNPRATIGPNRE